MATTSIWAVKGWIGKLVCYVENPDKTAETGQKSLPAKREIEGRAESAAQTGPAGKELEDLIAYAVNSKKTIGEENTAVDDENVVILQRYVTGINCTPDTAQAEMTAAKRRFGKDGGIVAYHGYQSFAPGECTAPMAHEIGVRLAKELWGSRYQVLVATHLDRAHHLHNHFVVNSVSYTDGKRYHRTKQDYLDMRRTSDRLCEEYGLSTIRKPERRGAHYAQWQAEQEEKPTYRSMMKADVDDAIARSMTEKQFLSILREKGYEIKVGKDITLRQKDRARGMKLMRNFGEAYSAEAIRNRILENTFADHSENPAQMAAKKRPGQRRYRFPVHESRKNRKRKIKGFRALYLHYSYLLGILPKQRPAVSPTRLHFLLREDLIKLNLFQKETKLLCHYQIDTAEQLAALQDDLKNRLTDLDGQRRKLSYRQRSIRDETELADTKEKISQLSLQIRGLRESIRLCDDIAVRSGVIREKITIIHDEKKPKKEEKSHEYIR